MVGVKVSVRVRGRDGDRDGGRVRGRFRGVEVRWRAIAVRASSAAVFCATCRPSSMTGIGAGMVVR